MVLKQYPNSPIYILTGGGCAFGHLPFPVLYLQLSWNFALKVLIGSIRLVKLREKLILMGALS